MTSQNRKYSLHWRQVYIITTSLTNADSWFMLRFNTCVSLLQAQEKSTYMQCASLFSCQRVYQSFHAATLLWSPRSQDNTCPVALSFFCSSCRWQEYLYLKGKTSYHSTQDTIYTMFMPQSAGCSSTTPSDRDPSTVLYKQTNTHNLTTAKQIQVSEAVTKFVIGCSLPLSIVEDTHFRNLLQCLYPR